MPFSKQEMQTIVAQILSSPWDTVKCFTTGLKQGLEDFVELKNRKMYALDGALQWFFGGGDVNPQDLPSDIQPSSILRFFLKVVGINTDSLDALLGDDTDPNHKWLRDLPNQMSAGAIFAEVKAHIPNVDLQQIINDFYEKDVLTAIFAPDAIAKVFATLGVKLIPIPGPGLIKTFLDAIDWLTKNATNLAQFFMRCADLIKAIAGCMPVTVAERIKKALQSGGGERHIIIRTTGRIEYHSQCHSEGLGSSKTQS